MRIRLRSARRIDETKTKRINPCHRRDGKG
jgi:hypothetical protein